MPILIDESDNHSSLQSQPPANPLPSSPDIINFDWGLLDNPSHVVLDLPPEQEASTMVLKQPVMDANVLVLQTIQQPHGGGSLGKTRLCTLDILMHLPRSVFSQKQLDLFLWLLKVNDVDDFPSVKAMQSLNSALQKCCGIGTIAYKGALGHHYHEMSNPKGLRWLREVPDEQLTPMARLNSHNYYIHKPAMLSDGCNDHPIMFARCWAMEPVDTDHQRSWKVIKSIVDSKTSSTSKWAFTDLNVGNQWRALLKGHKVLSFPIWMYCDDTSGLPQSEAQQEYNDCMENFFVVHAGSKELMLVPTSLSQQASVSTKKAMEPKVGKPQKKQETITQLHAQFVQASQLDSKTKVDKMRTESGIKDTFQKYFIDKVVGSYQRLRGLDPHQDTPVKILHVVLLGFVKYLWRDLIQLQLKGKLDKLNLLATRLLSLNVNGLGISPLAGKTLGQYSGSLTGRDFCAIVQVAPFVIYDLVSKECMDTWVALSKLIPLIYQPEIHDINAHLVSGSLFNIKFYS
ncbi:hypothetical protein SERLADRAFT_412260 [Serpula lacrymans var. lacrymans S7.9]|uniref:Uncharacterized protein n=1 Tax=Serpula lacrymans var. lacrymans (strain S7.9) TaxID=578457 RepID=F8PES8_SERL9|nr:uncharacterized protein SERLADRAFT_412260 [Serpula lacrymans var. lacrymans S7.9]EGO18368.1 hypothetical protein SERLADRAFT_412260 [Serpula lacrymans var. lacrymans S7.9]